MASFEDYDEFGNYIGADLDSDDEDEVPQVPFQQRAPEAAPLEGYEDTRMQETEQMALMEVDDGTSVNANIGRQPNSPRTRAQGCSAS